LFVSPGRADPQTVEKTYGAWKTYFTTSFDNAFSAPKPTQPFSATTQPTQPFWVVKERTLSTS
jgi:hypothetical protein